MRPAELKDFYATHYQPQNAYLLVVGDVTPDSILPKLEKAIGGWKNGGAVPKPALPAATQHARAQIYLVDKPGAAQSAIRMGWIGVARSTPDYFVLDVMNTILGGSFTSRLNRTFAKNTATPTARRRRSTCGRRRDRSSPAANVQTDKTVESLREFFKELDGMKQPVPADELTRARNLEALSFPAAFETTSGMAGNLAGACRSTGCRSRSSASTCRRFRP